MCFSATASFGASGVLLVIGAASIIKAGGIRQLPFVVIPLFFSVQQFTEGLLWLSLDGGSSRSEKTFTHVYLFFAQILWPVWIPLAFLWLENKDPRRLLLKILCGSGFLVASYVAYCLFAFEVRAEIKGHHIKYLLDYPRPLRGYGNILYGLATIAPAFVSSVRGMRIFGILVVVAYGASFFYFRDSLISVWCYFAAVISISVYYLVPVASRTRGVFIK